MCDVDDESQTTRAQETDVVARRVMSELVNLRAMVTYLDIFV